MTNKVELQIQFTITASKSSHSFFNIQASIYKMLDIANSNLLNINMYFLLISLFNSHTHGAINNLINGNMAQISETQKILFTILSIKTE